MLKNNLNNGRNYLLHDAMKTSLILESDVDRVELFRLTFEIFRRRLDGVVIYFFNSNFKFFDDASEYVVFIFSSKVHVNFSSGLGL